MNPVTKFAVAMSAAIALCVAGVLMDGPSDAQAAQDVADYSAALADGGVSLCKEFGRVPVWTKSGDLVCRVPAAVVARGGAL